MNYRKIPARALDASSWGARSVVVDSDACLLPVYRGQHGAHDHWTESWLGSLSFGTPEAANQYAKHPNRYGDIVVTPKVFPVFLDVKRPLVNQKHAFLDLVEYHDIFGAEETRRVAVKYEDYIYGTSPWADVRERFRSVAELADKEPSLLLEMYFEVYALLDDPEEVEHLRQHGFDGAVYAGSGATALQPEYRVFSADQVRSIWDAALP
jgi:hypothetical protein